MSEYGAAVDAAWAKAVELGLDRPSPVGLDISEVARMLEAALGGITLRARSPVSAPGGSRPRGRELATTRAGGHMPVRSETFCDGHLVKEFAQVSVGPTAEKPYDEYVDGRHRWLVDGAEISEQAAQAMIRGWPLAVPGAAEPTSDYELLVSVRVYGDGSAQDAARALTSGRGTFDLPGDAEVEILAARPAQ